MIDRQREYFFVFAVLLLGTAIRLSAPFSASFPLNDGGLFYQMIRDLQANQYKLPVHTEYNFALIPYAYPPLAFYLFGSINQISGIPLLKLMQFLPAGISIMTIPAFYLLAKQMLEDPQQALWSTLAFTLTPRAFDWLIMGGGVTRSLGFLFAIFAIRQAWLLFSRPSTSTFFFTAALSLLVVATHPEASIHVLIAAILFYLWKDRSIQGASRAGAVGIIVLIFSAPWWGTVLRHHGIDPFLAALHAARSDTSSALTGILTLLKFDFTDEPFLQIISVAGLIGLFFLAAQSKLLLPAWVMFTSILEPRGGTLYLILPVAMAAGILLNQVILPTLVKKGNSKKVVWISFVSFFILYGSISSMNVAHTINQRLTLTQQDLDAFAWVKANTPEDSTFILLTQGLPLNDSTSEWFPVLAERRSAATIFGYEWVNDGEFSRRITDYKNLQICATQGLICLENENLNYVYIQEKKTTLAEQLKHSPEYQLVYQAGKILIFKKNFLSGEHNLLADLRKLHKEPGSAHAKSH